MTIGHITHIYCSGCGVASTPAVNISQYTCPTCYHFGYRLASKPTAINTEWVYVPKAEFEDMQRRLRVAEGGGK